jgi:hypothetical protein
MVDRAQIPAPDLPETQFPAAVAVAFGLASPGVARLYELLDVVEGMYMEALDLASADRAYQHYVENCQRLGSKPLPRERALVKWSDAIAAGVTRHYR